MAKKGGGRRRRFFRSRSRGMGKQGIVSWLTSVFALIIGLFPFWGEVSSWAQGTNTFGQMGDNLQRYYNPLRRDSEALKVGYGSLLGGLIFKVITSELTKRAKVRSLVPALHA